MNTNEQSNITQKTKEPFLTEQEEKDFVIWLEAKIHTGSKPYESEGSSFENSCNNSTV